MEFQGTWNIQNNLETKKKVRGLVLPNFKTNCTATAVKTEWVLSGIKVGIVWQEEKHIDQWNRIESLE